ncbi:DUF1214 domain-containing protein [Thalassotalea psychrophila]|uniref:DUF1214 domain-containing protein n=1 Tax=Thalassotalea psychrophila TaxID=3065647 RepID=A0ABY9TZ94_9GAMM|nr:DUF1214 domain-containing protein [Colwelliaceae bacterium SQ149]
MNKLALITMTLCMSAVSMMPATSMALEYSELTTNEKMVHRRAVETAVWAMPLLNYKTMRDAHLEGAGLDYNDVGYYSKIQTWRTQVTTPNNTTPYIFISWQLNQGPVVIEIPASSKDVKVFGTLMDSWQRPLDDVGVLGRDGGRGAKYLMVPPNYQGKIPTGYIMLEQATNIGYTALRPIIADASAESLKEAEAWTKQINVYPLAQAANPRKTKHIDLHEKFIDGIVEFNAEMFENIHSIIQEEVVEEKDLAIMGQLKGIGIEKGEKYQVNARKLEIFQDAAEQAQEYLKDQLFNVNTSKFYGDQRQWRNLAPKAGLQTIFSWLYPNHLALDARASTYYSAFTSVKNFGAATYYLMDSYDSNGQALDGGKNYQMTIPADVPVKHFWSVLAHDADTAGWFKHQPKAGVASSDKGLVENEDGTVDIYFGPQAPKGKEANWVPTTAEKNYFLLFRFYGPTKEVFIKNWKLNDLVMMD